MTEAPVVGEVLHGAAEVDEHVEIGQRTERRPEQHCFPTIVRRSTHTGNGGPKHGLRQGIHPGILS